MDAKPVRHALAEQVMGVTENDRAFILLEVLQGARDAPHAARIERNMRRFPIAPMLDADLAVRAAQNHRFLRSRGITVRKTADLIIGTLCMARDHPLLHNDRGFEPMAAHLGLQLA